MKMPPFFFPALFVVARIAEDHKELQGGKPLEKAALKRFPDLPKGMKAPLVSRVTENRRNVAATVGRRTARHHAGPDEGKIENHLPGIGGRPQPLPAGPGLTPG